MRHFIVPRVKYFKPNKLQRREKKMVNIVSSPLKMIDFLSIVVTGMLDLDPTGTGWTSLPQAPLTVSAQS